MSSFQARRPQKGRFHEEERFKKRRQSDKRRLCLTTPAFDDVVPAGGFDSPSHLSRASFPELIPLHAAAPASDYNFSNVAAEGSVALPQSPKPHTGVEEKPESGFLSASPDDLQPLLSPSVEAQQECKGTPLKAPRSSANLPAVPSTLHCRAL